MSESEKNLGRKYGELLTAGDLLEKEIQLNWVIDELIAKNTVTMATGSSGIGKTCIALELARAISTGSKAFDKFSSSQGSVLIVDAENPEFVLKSRIKALGFGKDTPVSFLLHGGNKVDNSDHLASLLSMVKKTKPSLVIFDPFVRIHTKDENDSGEMRSVMEALRKIAAQGPAVFIIHHTRKGGLGTADDKVRGSSDILASVDSHIVISKEGDKLCLKQNKNRFKKRFKPFTIKMNASTDEIESITYSGTSKESGNNKEEFIIKALRKKGKLNIESLLQLAEEEGIPNCKKSTLDNCLKNLCEAGRLNKEGKPKGSGYGYLYSVKRSS